MPTVFQMQPGPSGRHLNREIKEYLTTEYCANPAKYIQPALSWPCSEQVAGCRPAELPSHPVCSSFMDTLLGHRRRTTPGRARLCYSGNWWEITLCLLPLPPYPRGDDRLPSLRRSPSPRSSPRAASWQGWLWRMEKCTALETRSPCYFLPPKTGSVVSLHQI